MIILPHFIVGNQAEFPKWADHKGYPRLPYPAMSSPKDGRIGSGQSLSQSVLSFTFLHLPMKNSRCWSWPCPFWQSSLIQHLICHQFYTMASCTRCRIVLHNPSLIPTLMTGSPKVPLINYDWIQKQQKKTCMACLVYILSSQDFMTLKAKKKEQL